MTPKFYSYKSYTGSAEISFEDNCLYGKILFIEDSITYEAETPVELEAAFQAAVDRYVAYCESTGKSPNKPYSGTFNVRVGMERHRDSCKAAAENGQNLNEFVCSAIDEKLTQRNPAALKEIHHHHHQAQNSYDEDSAQAWHDQSPNEASLRH
jgi:predicted HicB family RNase H-like nuclease